MIQKSWSAPYADLLSSLKFHTLQYHHLQSKLHTFFKINNGLIPIASSSASSFSAYVSPTLYCPNDFSFLLHLYLLTLISYLYTIKLWNSLPNSVKGSISYIQFYLTCKIYLLPLSLALAITYHQKRIFSSHSSGIKNHA